jgi:hypothetical protein
VFERDGRVVGRMILSDLQRLVIVTWALRMPRTVRLRSVCVADVTKEVVLAAHRASSPPSALEHRRRLRLVLFRTSVWVLLMALPLTSTPCVWITIQHETGAEYTA